MLSRNERINEDKLIEKTKKEETVRIVQELIKYIDDLVDVEDVLTRLKAESRPESICVFDMSTNETICKYIGTHELKNHNSPWRMHWFFQKDFTVTKLWKIVKYIQDLEFDVEVDIYIKKNKFRLPRLICNLYWH